MNPAKIMIFNVSFVARNKETWTPGDEDPQGIELDYHQRQSLIVNVILTGGSRALFTPMEPEIIGSTLLNDWLEENGPNIPLLKGWYWAISLDITLDHHSWDGEPWG